MTRPNNKKIRSLPPVAAMVIAVAIGLVRTEKTWAEAFNSVWIGSQPTCPWPTTIRKRSIPAACPLRVAWPAGCWPGSS